MTKFRKTFYPKLSLIAAICLTWTTLSFAQILTPVHWSYAAKKTGPTSGVIFIKAIIDKGWHIYSVNQPDGGPIKTSFKFDPSTAYQAIGLSLIHISEPTRQAEISYAVFCL